MTLTRDAVMHLAQLARLDLEEPEVDGYLCDLERIVSYVDQLAEVDTSAVDPTAHLAVSAAPLRLDQPLPGLTHEQALSESPSVRDGDPLLSALQAADNVN